MNFIVAIIHACVPRLLHLPHTTYLFFSFLFALSIHRWHLVFSSWLHHFFQFIHGARGRKGIEIEIGHAIHGDARNSVLGQLDRVWFGVLCFDNYYSDCEWVRGRLFHICKHRSRSVGDIVFYISHVHGGVIIFPCSHCQQSKECANNRLFIHSSGLRFSNHHLHRLWILD